ncbi:MAG: hypothetical protein ACRC2V_12460 [Xenococcaceae cyanobacterium]
MPIRYLNTDLDLVATVDLGSLAKYFESYGFLILDVERGDDGLWFARLETNKQYEEPESNIAAMLAAIERFDEPEKIIWQSLTLCEFNIGYDCGNEPWAFNQGISNALLCRMAKIGASMRITLYPSDSKYKTI